MEIFKKDNLVLFFTSVFAFALPLSTRSANYLLLVLLFVITLYCYTNKDFVFSSINTKISLLFQTSIVIILFLVFGLIYSNNIYEGLNLIKHDMFFILVPLVFMWLRPSLLIKIREKSIIFFVLGSFVSAVFLLINNFIKLINYSITSTLDFKVLFSYEFTYHEFASFLGFHPTMLGLYFVFAFVLLNENKKIVNNRLLYFLNITLIVCLVFLNSRAAFLFLGMYFFYYLVSLYRKSSFNKKVLGRIVGCIVALVLVSIVVFKDTYIYNRLLGQVVWELTENKGTTYDGVYSNDSRMSRWKAIVEKSSEAPIIGFGTGMQGEVVLQAYEEHNLLYALKHKYDPHNYYLFVLIENGIIGLFLFFYFLIYQIFYYFKKKDICAFFLLLFIVVGCVFDSILYITPCILLVAFFSNLFFFQNKTNIDES